MMLAVMVLAVPQGYASILCLCDMVDDDQERVFIRFTDKITSLTVLGFYMDSFSIRSTMFSVLRSPFSVLCSLFSGL